MNALGNGAHLMIYYLKYEKIEECTRPLPMVVLNNRANSLKTLKMLLSRSFLKNIFNFREVFIPFS